ncbi:spore germination protein [Paenibacillus sp. CC-CFT747]|nr:spore germination protein [Paenibacillus sp. CC-CFT747]
MDEKVAWLRKRLDKCSDVQYYPFLTADGRRCTAVYIMNMTDQNLFLQQVVQPLMAADEVDSGLPVMDRLFRRSRVPVTGAQHVGGEEGLNKLLDGQILLAADGEPGWACLPLTNFDKRSISEPSNEVVIRGPREAFVEDIATNLTLIRRKVKSPDFKTEEQLIGTYTQTKVVIAYIEGLCKPALVDEVKKRLSRIEMDGVLEGSYLEEYLEDNPFSPFPQIQYTERPDTAAAGLLEGRILIMCDGSPIQLMAPVTLPMLLLFSEDYYQRWLTGTWIRWIRYFFVVISLLLPSIYIAVTTFHPELMPSNLLMTVAGARETVPFPALIEALIMEITFEVLREAGIRTPKPIGQTVSILGAIVIGQAAVQAGIVSAPMVIIVSMSGIASFVIPHVDLGLAFRFLRFPVMFAAGSFGLFGISVSVILIVLHLVSLRSLGTPYMYPLAPIGDGWFRDFVLRAPIWFMKSRPDFYKNNPSNRMVYHKRPVIPEEEGD